MPRQDLLYFIAAFHGLSSGTETCSQFRAIVERFLTELDWSNDEIDAGLEALKRHLCAPTTPEEMIVHDANYFEITGAFGVAKAFIVGGSRGQSYERTLDIFEANLNRIVFRTPEGRRLFEPRKQHSRAFIHELRADLRGISNEDHPSKPNEALKKGQ